MLRWHMLAALMLVPAAAAADPAAAPSPSPSPPAVGATVIPNDPCTTLTQIVTRPTVTNSVCTVRPGHLLVESGYLVQSFSGSGVSVQVPQLNVRIGLPSAIELDVAPPSVVRSSIAGPATNGLSDAGAGVKYVIGATPKFSYGVQLSATVPSGSRDVSAGASQETGALNGSLALGPAFSLGATAAVASLAQNGASFGSFMPSLVLSATVGASTSVFAEAAQFTHALGPGSATRTQFLGGVSTGIGSFVQIDLAYAWSPTLATNRYQTIGVGLSYYR